MAWKKTVRKGYRKGKRAYKFARKHQTEAKQALDLAKKVARMVNVEYKRDIASYNSTITNTGVIEVLCNPAEGDTFNSRDGISVKPIRTSGRIFLLINPSATSSVVRFVLFRGKNENRVTYTTSDVLHTASGLTFQNPKDYQERFRTKVLYDRTYNLDSASRRSMVLNWNFKMYGHIQFGNNSTEIENGGIYLLMITNEPTNVPTVQYTLQTTFTDN